MEYLDIVNEKGEPTGETVERRLAHAKGILHRTSHVWIFRKNAGQLQVLLQKRAADKDSFPGCWDISSAGHIPAGFDFAESAIRELKEEIGVETDESRLIVCGDRYIAADGEFHEKPYHDRQYSRIFLLWDEREASEFRIQKEELEAVSWFDYEKVCDAVRNNSFKHCIEIEELEMAGEGIRNIF